MIRSNCFDCLDRTNLFQYQLVWEWLLRYCQRRRDLRHLVAASRRITQGPALGALFHQFTNPDDDQNATLQTCLRELWADLGDVLSMLYTGAASTQSAALRRGGHNLSTTLERGWRNVNRAYNARFTDEGRQAALDILLGKHRLARAPRPADPRRAPSGLLTVSVVTWNNHGKAFWEQQEEFHKTLQGTAMLDGCSADLLIFSFQEMVALTATNVVMQQGGDTDRQADFDRHLLAACRQVCGHHCHCLDSTCLALNILLHSLTQARATSKYTVSAWWASTWECSSGFRQQSCASFLS